MSKFFNPEVSDQEPNLYARDLEQRSEEDTPKKAKESVLDDLQNPLHSQSELLKNNQNNALRFIASLSPGGVREQDIVAALGEDFFNNKRKNPPPVEFISSREMRIHYEGGGYLQMGVSPNGQNVGVALRKMPMNETAAHDIIRMKKAQGKSVLELTGPKKDRQILWRAAMIEGVSVTSHSYKLNKEDRAFLEQLQKAQKQQAEENIENTEAQGPNLNAAIGDTRPAPSEERSAKLAQNRALRNANTKKHVPVSKYSIKPKEPKHENKGTKPSAPSPFSGGPKPPSNL